MKSDPDEIRRALMARHHPGDLIEVRVPPSEHNRKTISGYFNDPEKLIKAVLGLRGNFPGIYVTLNPVIPALLARAANRLKHDARETTQDEHIVCRHELLIDCDPERPAGISATDAQHEAAIEKARVVQSTLLEEGWPLPILADSGNGGHLRYFVDLPNDDESTSLIERVLQGLAQRFDDAIVQIDKAVFNASRLVKLYGTPACKGDDTPERPHRLSRILEIPDESIVVSRELLERIAAPEKEPLRVGSSGRPPSQFNIEAFVQRHLKPRSPVENKDHRGGRKWVLEQCPFNPEHQGKDAAVFEFADGSFGFKCFHDSCTGKGWKDVRALYDPPEFRSGHSPRGTYSRPAPDPFDKPRSKKAAAVAQRKNSGHIERPKEPALLLQATPDWREKLILNYRKRPKGNLYNVILALRESREFKGVFRYNRFTEEITISRPLPWGKVESWSDTDTTATASWCQSEDIDASSATVAEAIALVAKDDSFHPVQDYLLSLKWDGDKRIDTWLTDCCGTSPSNYTAAVGRKWLISACARAMEPGCKVDTALILYGEQGQGKSALLAALAGRQWFTDDITELGTKDGVMQLQGHWICEMSDLHQFRGAIHEKTKAFIVRRIDKIRLPYGRGIQDFPRQCVFAGTTNNEKPLGDETGNRRYWIIECKFEHIKVADIERDRDQLWAEAMSLYMAKEPWHIEDESILAEAKAVQEEYLESQDDPWNGHIRAFVDAMSPTPDCYLDVEPVTILEKVLKIPPADQTRPHQYRIAAALKKLKFKRARVTVHGRRVWIYRRGTPPPGLFSE